MKYSRKALCVALPLFAAACAAPDAGVPTDKDTFVSKSSGAATTIDNASFEQWQGGAPSSWTTIDSGLRLAPTTDVARAGATSAAVTVVTRSQKSTDLRQRISVAGGARQTFSVWVMHTEGAVRARLFVDGYHVYSDPSIRGEWQRLSHDLTSERDGEIEVGLRFYGDASFDGSETVYVDDFQPAVEAPTQDDDGCAGRVATLTLRTDGYGSETSWQLTSTDGTVSHSGDGYGNNAEVVETFCLPAGQYDFTIRDAYGDGICCRYGNGSYALTVEGESVASGGEFSSADSTRFTVEAIGEDDDQDDDDQGDDQGGDPDDDQDDGDVDVDLDLGDYYAAAQGLQGYALKTALHGIIRDHQTRGYSAIWGFIDQHDRDLSFEGDGSILDIYSENPDGADPYTYANTSRQCGGFRREGDCYNREHSFPKSWFGGKVEPMNSDIHHIFPTDGYVNGRRGNFPYGEVASASYDSDNGSRLGASEPGSGYSDVVFEPIDAFKGDLARAYFYMATRYEDVIDGWQSNRDEADAVLNGTRDQVFEAWFLDLLIAWHEADPVSDKERARNDAAYDYQQNRNPFVDHPALVQQIWGD